MASYDLFSFGCSDVNESALHVCNDAVSVEKSNAAKTLFHAKPYTSDLTLTPSNSTNTGTNEGQNPSHSTETEQYNWFEKVLGSNEGINQPEFSPEDGYLANLAYPEEEIFAEAVSATCEMLTPTTESFTNEEPRSVEYNMNMNKMEIEEECIEEESTTSKVPSQSQFKNKPKELLEKAVAIFKYFAGLDANEFNTIMRENMKNSEEWMMDGEVIRKMMEQFEMQVISGNDKQAKKTKKAILEKLETKQYCCVAELYNFMQRIQQFDSQVINNFNQGYKKKISQAFFKKTEFEAGDLFSWILLLQIAQVILPQSQETLQLLPLKKESVFLSAWMFQSPMSQENKDLYRGSYVRSHLRKVLGDAQATLMEQAEAKMDAERLNLLKEVCGALAGGAEAELPQRGQRPVYRIAGARATAVNYEIMGDMTGKRSSDLCSVKSEKVTKKVNKNRK